FAIRYLISLHPSFGQNPYVGGDELDRDLREAGASGNVLRRVDGALQPDRLLTAASARWDFGRVYTAFGVQVRAQDGHQIVTPPEAFSAYDPLGTTSNRSTRFGYLHARYQDRVMLALLDGHVGYADPEALRDRRRWVDRAARLDAADWEG
ncbi:MAG: hypothetical protein AAF235_11215, partial [Planctomycetota bacterium]